MSGIPFDLIPNRRFRMGDTHDPASGAHGVTDQYLQELKRAAESRANFSNFNVGVPPITTSGNMTLVRAKEERFYFAIQNNTNATMFISFGTDSYLNAMQLNPGTFYEPFKVPQDDIYMYNNALGGLTFGATLILGF